MPFLPGSIWNRILTIFDASDSSTNSRFPLFKAGLEVITRRPLSGAGLGTAAVQRYVKLLNFYHARTPFVHSHNIYLQVWAEMGVMGFVGFAGSALWGVKRAAHAVRHCADGAAKTITAAACAALVLLGEGPLLEEMRQRAEALGLAGRVHFAGLQRDTRAFYSAMDGFLLPSLFEGLPVVLVEAQAAGLPCFVSDTVDPSAAFCSGVHFLPLADAGAWADAVLAAPLCRNPDALAQARAAGYDIVTTAVALQAFYLAAHAAAPERGPRP